MNNFEFRMTLRKVLAMFLCAAMGLGALPAVGMAVQEDAPAPEPNLGVASVTVGDEYLATYSSLPEAAADANTHEDAVVTLYADCALEESLVLSGNLTLELNGHAIGYAADAGAAIIVEDAGLTVQDTAGGGRIWSAGGPAIYAQGENTNLYIRGGSFTGLSGLYCEGIASLEADGARIEAMETAAVMLINVASASFGADLRLLCGMDAVFGLALYAHNSTVAPISAGYFNGGIVGVSLAEGFVLSEESVYYDETESLAYAVPVLAQPMDIEGTLMLRAQSGLLLTAAQLAQTPAALQYSWYRDGALIEGETKAFYVLSSADEGREISAALTAGGNSLLSESYLVPFPEAAEETEIAAVVGNDEFVSLADAVMAANARGGCTIQLMADVEALFEPLVFMAPDITLDLNGHSIYSYAQSCAIEVLSTGFTLTDSLGNGALLQLSTLGALHLTDAAALSAQADIRVENAFVFAAEGPALLLYGGQAAAELQDASLMGGIVSLSALSIKVAGESLVCASHTAIYAYGNSVISISGESRVSGETAIYAGEGVELLLQGGYYAASQTLFAGTAPQLSEGYAFDETPSGYFTAADDGTLYFRAAIPFTGSLSIEGSHNVDETLTAICTLDVAYAALRFVWYGADTPEGSFEMLAEGEQYTLTEADAGRCIKLVVLGVSNETDSYAGRLESEIITVAIPEEDEELSAVPTAEPSTEPSDEPSDEPNDEPSMTPSVESTPTPVETPAATPTVEPTMETGEAPTTAPVTEQTPEPAAEQTPAPGAETLGASGLDVSGAPVMTPDASNTAEPTEENSQIESSPTPEFTEEPPETSEPSMEPTPAEQPDPTPVLTQAAHITLPGTGETLYFDSFDDAFAYAVQNGTAALPLTITLEKDAEIAYNPGCTGAYAIDLNGYALYGRLELMPMLFNNAYVSRRLEADGTYVYMRYTGDTSAYDQCGYFGVALSPADGISLNYFVLADYASRVEGVYFWKNGAAVVRKTADKQDINGFACSLYSYTGIAAKDMSDALYCCMYFMDGDAVVYINFASKATSVEIAACEILASATDEKLIQLLVDMLDYGAKVQIYKDYNTGSLANRYLSYLLLADNTHYASDYSRTEPYDFSTFQSGTVVQAAEDAALDALLSSTSLGLGSTVSVNLYLDVAGSGYTAENLRLLVWTDAQEGYVYGSQTLSLTLRSVTDKAGSDYAAVLGGIRPSQMRTKLYIAVYDTEHNMLGSVKCVSVEGFAGEYEATDTMDVVSALLHYSVSAEAYGR